MSHKYFLLLIAIFFFYPPSALADRAKNADPDWLAEGEVVVADGAWGVPKSQALAVGRKHAIAGTSAPFAIRAGLEALNQGGSAADAVMTAAMAQIAIAVGSWVSYNGIFQMLYYDAETGSVQNINAAYKTVSDEKDPMSIPAPAFMTTGDMRAPPAGNIDGRAVLVPGFMKGVEAVHARYGKLPFASLFEPSIYIAEKGMEVSPELEGYFEWRKDSLSRLAETRETMLKEDGSVYRAGDVFKQPALAKTLQKVAKEGAAYMYEGEWAEKFVAAVQADGGKLSMEDLSRYEVAWDKPLKTEHNGYVVFGSGTMGGRNVITALDLVRDADIAKRGHYSQDGAVFRDLAKIANQSAFGGLFPADETNSHSDAIVAVDQWGNVAAITHSFNGIWWGELGMVIDGITITDSGSFQQAGIKAAGPGNRLPDPIEPVLVMKEGKPAFAFSSIANGLHYHTVTALVNALDFGMDPKSAIDTPSFLAPDFTAVPDLNGAKVIEGDFDASVLREARAKGALIEEVGVENAFWEGVGIVVGLEVDAESGLVKAAAPLYGPGASFAR